jgi:hypothetical protein
VSLDVQLAKPLEQPDAVDRAGRARDADDEAGLGDVSLAGGLCLQPRKVRT